MNKLLNDNYKIFLEENRNNEDYYDFEISMSNYVTLKKNILDTKIEIKEKKLFMNLKVYDYCGDNIKISKFLKIKKYIFIFMIYLIIKI